MCCDDVDEVRSNKLKVQLEDYFEAQPLVRPAPFYGGAQTNLMKYAFMRFQIHMYNTLNTFCLFYIIQVKDGQVTMLSFARELDSETVSWIDQKVT